MNTVNKLQAYTCTVKVENDPKGCYYVFDDEIQAKNKEEYKEIIKLRFLHTRGIPLEDNEIHVKPVKKMLKYKIQINDNLTLVAEGSDPEEAYNKVQKAIKNLKLLTPPPSKECWRFLGVVDE
tara:strand:- start:386 stop:754 length:369 start_codon:yes stop_codon:yes gene_type:complete